MKAMIMAAGVGSRLMPLTANIPKPMVPVANIPVMEHAINLLKKHEITDIVANVHYLPDVIRNYFLNGTALGVNLSYSEEKVLLGTAGGVKNNQKFLDETFVILSGDGLTDIDLEELICFHKAKRALATIALKKVDDVEKFGVVITDSQGRIKSFQEKPKKEDALSNLVNTGIYVLEPEIFNYIPDGQPYDFGKDLFPMLVEKELPFFGCEVNGYWCDIGDLYSYRQANYDVLRSTVKTVNFPSDVNIGKNVNIHPTVQIHGKVLIGDGVTIEKNVEIIGNTIIGSNCKVGSGSIIQNGLLWNGVSIAKGAVLTECIIGEQCTIETEATIGRGSVLSDHCIIGAQAQVLSYKYLESGKIVPKYSVAG